MPIPLGVLAVAGAGGGAAANSFDLLETTLISTNTASVTFSSLGSYSAYKHLQIRMTVRGNRNSTIGDIRARFNADSGSNYAFHRLLADPPSVISQANTSQTFIRFGTFVGNNGTANVFSASVVDILDFGSSSKNTTIRSLDGFKDSSSFPIGLYSGFWNNTNAVTSIELYPESDSFVSGTRMSLYGIK
jgi:hypothetical protein